MTFSTPLGQRLEREFGLGVLYALRGTIEAPGEALIVGLDRASISWLQRDIYDLGDVAPSLDQCLASRAREAMAQARNVNHVPRGLHACLLRDISVKRPRLIVFDINFNVEKPEDAVLGEAIREAGNVVLLEKIIRAMPKSDPGKSAMTVRLRPVEVLRDGAIGTVGFQVDGSGTDVTTGYVRRFTEFPDLQVLPSAAWAQYTGNKYPAIRGGDNIQRIWLYGPPGTIPTFSLRDIFDRRSTGKVPDDLKETVVFVGASDLAHGTPDDHFKVPVIGSGANLMSGVEIAASAFLNLLHQQTLSSLSPFSRTMLVFGYAFVLALAGVSSTGIRGLLLIVVVAAAYAIASAMLFVEGRIWMPIVVPVVLATPLAVLLALERRYRFARSLVLRLAPRHFAEVLLDDPTSQHPAVHEEISTVMVVDVARSVSIAEPLSAKDFAGLMARFFDNATAAVDRYRGEVVKYSGDGFLAVFTESFAGKDHVALACHAALAICSRNAQDNAEYAWRHGAQLYLRFGLNTGPVAAGMIGTTGRFSIDVLGDTVNVAARLEQLGKEVERDGRDVILVSEAVRQSATLSDDHFESLGEKTLRGRSARTLAYRLQDPATRNQCVRR